MVQIVDKSTDLWFSIGSLPLVFCNPPHVVSPPVGIPVAAQCKEEKAQYEIGVHYVMYWFYHQYESKKNCKIDEDEGIFPFHRTWWIPILLTFVEQYLQCRVLKIFRSRSQPWWNHQEQNPCYYGVLKRKTNEHKKASNVRFFNSSLYAIYKDIILSVRFFINPKLLKLLPSLIVWNLEN